MITYALLRKMADDVAVDFDEFHGLVIDKNCYWEQAPLRANGDPAHGVWVITRGGNAANSPKGYNLRSTVDFYVALPNRIMAEKVHQEILLWLIENPCFCELSGDIGGVSYRFDNIRVRPTTTPQNYLITENDLIVKVASADIIYDINK